VGVSRGRCCRYVELKAPARARPGQIQGERQDAVGEIPRSAQPDLYHGNQWALYRAASGRAIDSTVGDVTTDGAKASAKPTRGGVRVAAGFPAVATTARHARALAETLAPLCRLLRAEVGHRAELRIQLAALAVDWRHYLFPTPMMPVADAYARP